MSCDDPYQNYINILSQHADLSKVRTLERGARSLKSEKVHPGGGDLISARINGRQGLEEGQRGAIVEAQEDVSHLMEKLTEVRQQKVKFARLAGRGRR